MEINFTGKIGFEIECIAKKENVPELQRLCNELNYRYGDDFSISDFNRHKYTSQEMVSRVYNLTEIKQAFIDIEKILKLVKVNESCGLHIHLSFDKMTNYYKLLCWKFVNTFQTKYSSTFKKPKEQARITKHHCKFYTTSEQFENITKQQLEYYYRHCSRYQAINFNSYKKYKTIEFRIFAATNKIKTFKKNVKFLLTQNNSFLQTENFKEIIMEKSKPREPTNDKVIIKEIITLGDLQCAI